MKTEAMEELLGRYIDGELDAAQKEHVEAELRNNPQYRELLHAYQQIDSLTKKAVAYEPGEAYWDTFNLRLHQKMEARPKVEPAGFWAFLQQWLSVPVLRLASVTIPVVLVGFVGLYVYQNRLDQQEFVATVTEQMTLPAPAITPALEDKISSETAASVEETGSAASPVEAPAGASSLAQPAAAPLAAGEARASREIVTQPAPAVTDLPAQRWKDQAANSNTASAGTTAPRPTASNELAELKPVYKKSEPLVEAEKSDSGPTTPSALAAKTTDHAVPMDKTGTLGDMLAATTQKSAPMEAARLGTDESDNNGLRGSLMSTPHTPLSKVDRPKLPDRLLNSVRIAKEMLLAGPFDNQARQGFVGNSRAKSYGAFPVDSQPVLKSLWVEQGQIYFTELTVERANASAGVVAINAQGKVGTTLANVNLTKLRQTVDAYVDENGRYLLQAADQLPIQDGVEKFPLTNPNLLEGWEFYDFFWNEAEQTVWARFHSSLLPSSAPRNSHRLGEYGALWLRLNPESAEILSTTLSRLQVVVWE